MEYIEDIVEALEECLDVTVDDVVYMIYKRQEELSREGPDDT